MIGIQASERNGDIVGAVQVNDNEEMMLISNQGTLVRSKVSEVSVLGRNTQGVRLIRLRNDEQLTGLERVDEPEEVEFEESEDGTVDSVVAAVADEGSASDQHDADDADDGDAEEE